MPDGDDVSVALIDPPTPRAPILTIFHGLEGTVRSTYAQGLMHQARRRGGGAAMLIWRTCDGRIPRTPRMYHSGETSDADAFMRLLAQRHPESPVLATGVSLGGNVLLKWLGERGAGIPQTLRAAAAVSTPFDLGAGAQHLERGFSRVYVRHFVRGLRRKAEAALAVHPGMPVDRTRLAAAASLWEFDDAFTAPVHGFAGADDYYALAWLPAERCGSFAALFGHRRSVPARRGAGRGSVARRCKQGASPRVHARGRSRGLGQRFAVCAVLLYGRTCHELAGPIRVAISFPVDPSPDCT